MPDVRESEEYKSMTSYKACAIAEGFCEGEGASRELQIIAWQWISDTGLYHNLQGFYGRAVYDLRQQGIIEPPIQQKGENK